LNTSNKLGLPLADPINDLELLQKMSDLIFCNNDVRPTWIGPGYVSTDNPDFAAKANWANQHWALYYGFIHNETRRNDFILDLGCGSGFCTSNLAYLYPNAKIIASDTDKEVINFASTYNSATNVEYISSDITQSGLPSGIDTIFLVEILEHLKHSTHFEFIDRCLESLRDENSRIFLTTPNEQTYSDAERGHVGILTAPLFASFIEKYQANIESISFYDNTKLIDHEPEEYISKEPKSHYRLILKKSL
jgi:SAM-dependent methyltransferase